MLGSRIANSQAYRWGATALFLALAAIATALAFEHIGQYAPCPLCLQQRWAYYAGIPLIFAALAIMTAGSPRIAAGLFWIVSLAFLANAGLGIYHSGVEWGFWLGPDTCSGASPAAAAAGNFLDNLKNTTRIVRCDEAAWRFIGLSFAGWNVVLSLVISTAAAKAALEAREHEHYL